MGIVNCKVPINVQFEVTYACNNNCIFCYNPNLIDNNIELTTQEAVSIVKDLASCGVLSVNFNGGEPLTRDDFFEIVEVAVQNNLDIHMNTNATYIDKFNARMIAEYFPAICTTILSADNKIHDALSGRKRALSDTLEGIQRLQERSVYVSVNIMLSKMNLPDFRQTLDLLRQRHIRSVLVTRYIPCGKNRNSLYISDEEFLDAVRILYHYNNRHGCFDRIAFPQPFKLCKADESLRRKLAENNVPCNIGLCTASISPNGDLCPCNLVKNPVLGNLKENSFMSLWSQFEGDKFCMDHHLTLKCLACHDLENCGGGCKGYNDAIGKGW